ncbi:hypothetical protein DFS34DRAFT_650057 [Phlyctochytrium arcticum]|nr:hypothetical protein DFS34DRAFT_650057 [Phlyctochytrium arcticum]
MATTTTAKRLFIIRGPPGSGKSTLCREVAEHYCSEPVPKDPDQLEQFYKKHILCTSDLFISPEDQVFRYEHDKLVEKHEQNADRCLAAMKAGISPVVIVKFMTPVLVDRMNEEVELMSAENRHNLSADKIRRMLERWEGDDWTVGSVLASSLEETMKLVHQKVRARWESKLDAMHEIRRNLRAMNALSERKIRDVTTITNAHRAPREEEYDRAINRLVSKLRSWSLGEHNENISRGNRLGTWRQKSSSVAEDKAFANRGHFPGTWRKKFLSLAQEKGQYASPGSLPFRETRQKDAWSLAENKGDVSRGSSQTETWRR